MLRPFVSVNVWKFSFAAVTCISISKQIITVAIMFFFMFYLLLPTLRVTRVELNVDRIKNALFRAESAAIDNFP